MGHFFLETSNFLSPPEHVLSRLNTSKKEKNREKCEWGLFYGKNQTLLKTSIFVAEHIPVWVRYCEPHSTQYQVERTIGDFNGIMELLISMLKNIMMIICGVILSLCEIQTKIGEAEKYHHIEFFCWGPPMRRKFVCQKE